jgi:hypothetical protein
MVDELTISQLIPTAVERLVWGRGAGDGIQVVDTEFGKMGGLIWYLCRIGKFRTQLTCF